MTSSSQEEGMTEKFPELVEAAKKRLDHHQIGPGMAVLVVADTGTYAPLRDAVHTAAIASGADTTLMIVKAQEQPFQDIPLLLEEAIKRADYTYVLLSKAWFYDPSSERIRGHERQTGKRVVVWEGIEDAVGHFLALLPGNQEVIDRTNKMSEMLFRVKKIRITSAVGTDLTFERGDPHRQLMNNPIGQVNYSPLTIDSRMSIAKGARGPLKEVCSGTLMFQGAYRTLHPGPNIHKSLVHQPVRIDIDQGRITRIARDTEHGVFLDNWFSSWDDQVVYYLDHLNIGLDHRIRLEHLDNLAVHFNYGGILLGFGLCFSSNRGDPGVFRAKAHIEIHLTGASVFFDDRQILKDGDFLPDTGLRAANRRPGTPSPFVEVEGHVLPKIPTFR
jgi:hypothetical protein